MIKNLKIYKVIMIIIVLLMILIFFLIASRSKVDIELTEGVYDSTVVPVGVYDIICISSCDGSTMVIDGYEYDFSDLKKFESIKIKDEITVNGKSKLNLVGTTRRI